MGGESADGSHFGLSDLNRAAPIAASMAIDGPGPGPAPQSAACPESEIWGALPKPGEGPKRPSFLSREEWGPDPSGGPQGKKGGHEVAGTGRLPVRSGQKRTRAASPMKIPERLGWRHRRFHPPMLTVRSGDHRRLGRRSSRPVQVPAASTRLAASARRSGSSRARPSSARPERRPAGTPRLSKVCWTTHPSARRSQRPWSPSTASTAWSGRAATVPRRTDRARLSPRSGGAGAARGAEKADEQPLGFALPVPNGPWLP